MKEEEKNANSPVSGQSTFEFSNLEQKNYVLTDNHLSEYSRGYETILFIYYYTCKRNHVPTAFIPYTLESN